MCVCLVGWSVVCLFCFSLSCLLLVRMLVADMICVVVVWGALCRWVLCGVALSRVVLCCVVVLVCVFVWRFLGCVVLCVLFELCGVVWCGVALFACLFGLFSFALFCVCVALCFCFLCLLH